MIDRLVDVGLKVRFLTFSLATCLLAADGNRGLCFAFGVLLAAALKFLEDLEGEVWAAAEQVGPVPLAFARLAAQHQDDCKTPEEARPAHPDFEVKDGAEEEPEHNFSVREGEAAPTHGVFGLLFSARLKDIRAGVMPDMLITLYCNWDFVHAFLGSHVSILLKVQSMLVLFPCIGPIFWSLHGTYKPYDVRQNSMSGRTGDTRLTGLAGDLFAVGAVGDFGLGSFSVGMLVIICSIVKSRRDSMMELVAMRMFGYFYYGFAGNFWWWEVLVKLMDVLCVFLVSFVSMSADDEQDRARSWAA